MARTTFSGPVNSQNGFESGTSADPITVTTASNVSSSFVTASNTTGDVRLNYARLTFTSTGSGETIRAFTRVTGANGATGGTINGAHISTSINTGGSISGAANAIRATLGGTATAPGGTLAVLQLDTDFASGVTAPSSASFIRVSDSGAGANKIGNLFNIGPSGLLQAGTVGGTTGGLKILVGGTPYFISVGTTCA